MKNKLTETSVIILLLIGLTVSQIMTFFRLHEQDKVIDELVRVNTVLFEMARLQTELTKLDILERELKKELKKEVPEWKLQEI